MPKKQKKKSHKKTHKGFLSSTIQYWLIRGTIVAMVLMLAFVAYLDVDIRRQFEGQKWALPAHVYTRPMELYVGQQFDLELIKGELHELGYVQRSQLNRVGSYTLSVDSISIYQREFRFWDGLRPQQRIQLNVSGGVVSDIYVLNSLGQRTATEIVRLEPRLFGSASPLSHEDRTLLKLEDVPQALIDALIAIEDRQFYSHFGVNPVGIARAILRNLKAGRVVQGGSTLTQQLVKNYYLTSEQTYRRKFIELIMAVLLEIHYSKEEILQAYLNEVYLSQAGNRAIHGFALASQYFYGRPLQELDLAELALLAGINNGPSYYNPIRHPERALKRRDLVLKTMFEQSLIDQQQYTNAMAQKLNISVNASTAAPLSYPSFMDLVRNNLKNDYQEQDLLGDGLQIYTTLNPRLQQTLEQTVATELELIESRKDIQANSLQVAAVIVRTDNGEVAAMIGDRKASFSGYNRALSARRPVGSLLKPFVYLAALESPEDYSLATTIPDQLITVSQRGSPDWQPQNHDGKEHGEVVLIDALAKSYNLATVQLGMQLGVPTVSDLIRRVGYHNSFSELPSVLLGAVPMSVMDVAQLYLTLASDGFKTPIKSVRSVLSNQNEPLVRYSLALEQVVKPEFNVLINYALQEVVRNGTGRSVLRGFKYDYGLAGKTGTTDDYRDSWFAGYSGNYLMVVWVGRDDNQSTGLTGASGAARLWARTMQNLPLTRLELNYGEDVITKPFQSSQNPSEQDCSLSRRIPILKASLPLEDLTCNQRIEYDFGDDEQRVFEPKPESQKKTFWDRIFGKDDG